VPAGARTPDVDGAASVTFVGQTGDDLQPDAAVGRQRQRCAQGQLDDVGATDLIAGANRELGERGARQNGRSGDDVPGQPWVRAQPQPSGEDGRAGARQSQDGTE